MKRFLSATAAIAACLCVSTLSQAQDFTRAPSFGVVSLQSGFTPSPFQVELQSGGEVNSLDIFGLSCRGHIAVNPDYRVHFEAGQKALEVYVQAQVDTTLIINDPQGDWHCDDDSQGFNPKLAFERPLSGQYDIWVGTYGDASLQPAKLHIREVD